MENFTLIQILLIIIIPAFISAIPPIVVAITAKKSKLKEKAELKEIDANISQKVADAYDKIVTDLQERISKTEARQVICDDKIDKLTKRVAYLENGVRKLVAQVRSLGAEPVFDVTEHPQKG